ncbi:hypothetical protein BGZ54_010045 [Gamsiella multidivaricata]|nr:hypothetical protein BGZ54_010045 [Gamsiella multidivaricata]
MSNTTLAFPPIRSKKIVRAARVSILFCSDATGTDKRKPLDIVHLIPMVEIAKHRPVHLPETILQRLDANFSDKGYMRQPIFTKWIKALDNHIRGQRRHIALLMDSASTHNDYEKLSLANLSEAMKAHLRSLGAESKEHQIAQLQGEPIEKCIGAKGMVAKKNIAVLNYLNYLKMNYSEETEDMNSDKHRHRFIPRTEDDVGHEGDEA